MFRERRSQRIFIRSKLVSEATNDYSGRKSLRGKYASLRKRPLTLSNTVSPDSSIMTVSASICALLGDIDTRLLKPKGYFYFVRR